jgi:MoxR-like ATPase
MQGREFVIPEDVKAFADEVLVHRIQMRGSTRSDSHEASEILKMILSEAPVLK